MDNHRVCLLNYVNMGAYVFWHTFGQCRLADDSPFVVCK